MVRTLSLEGAINRIKKSSTNSFINKILTNPVLLSIVIVLFIVILITNSNPQKTNHNKLFKNIIFSILITSGLLFCHNNIVQNNNTKYGKREMESYFSGIAKGSTSNIDNIRESVYDEINGGELDNLNVDDFFR